MDYDQLRDQVHNLCLCCSGVGGGGRQQKRSAPDQGDRPTVKRARKCGLCGEEGNY